MGATDEGSNVLTKMIDIDEAQSHFQELIALVIAGAEVVLTDKTKPLIRLVPLTQQPALYEADANGVLPAVYDDEYNGWMRLTQASLANAYGEDEPEYTLSMVKEPNPEYEGR
ncbi:hypothetical protein BH10CHL1_BH10CHL1_50030 [soil metagenome]